MKRIDMTAIAGIVLALTALSGRPCWAGFGAHGGNSVVCFDDQAIPKAIRSGSGEILDQYIPHVTSVETFDLYQARQCHGLDCSIAPQIIGVKDGETPFQYAERIASRFDGALSYVSSRIRKGFEVFPNNHISLESHGLKKVDDTNEVGLIDSANCVLGTVAAQIDSGPDTYLYIDSRLYNHAGHSALSKAVLILHEFLYYFDRQGHQANDAPDSRDTRLRVAKLITAGPTVAEYINAFGGGAWQIADAYNLISDAKTGLIAAAKKKYDEVQAADGAKLYSEVYDFLNSVNKPAFYGGPRSLSTAMVAIDFLLSFDLPSGERAQVQKLYQRLQQYVNARADAVVQAARDEYNSKWQSKIMSMRYAPDSSKQDLEKQLLSMVDNEFRNWATVVFPYHTETAINDKLCWRDNTGSHCKKHVVDLGNWSTATALDYTPPGAMDVKTQIGFDLNYVVGN